MRRLPRAANLTRFAALGVAGALGLASPSAPAAGAGSASIASPVELRFPGSAPFARWDPAGGLDMVFVREAGGKRRAFFARTASAASPAMGPVAVSPEADDVDARGETSPFLEILPGGAIVAVYAVALPGTWKGEIRAQRSLDAGATWSAPVRVNDDERPGPHTLVSTALDASGRLLVAWLDSRAGKQGLRLAASRDGARFGRNATGDARTCECCGTAMTADDRGRFWIAYRDLEGKDLRNVAVVTGEPGHSAVSPPVTVSDDGWRLDGCPDSGPRLAAGGGELWVAWYTGAGPGVFAASSTDGGRTFSRRIRVSPETGGGAAAGHPDIARLPDGRLVALYESREGGAPAIFARTLDRSTRAFGPAARLVEDAVGARIVPGPERAALAYTSRSGNATEAVVSTKALERLSPGR